MLCLAEKPFDMSSLPLVIGRLSWDKGNNLTCLPIFVVQEGLHRVQQRHGFYSLVGVQLLTSELLGLQAGSIDVLHCYYAHGEDNSNFQRRAYWMLDP